jgi:hypothetical protein
MRTLPLFKARPSTLANIMTPLVGGLTEKQQETLDTYIKRDEDARNGVDKVKPLTANMREEMNLLIEKKNTPPQLSTGVTTILKEWYATTMYGDMQDTWSKQTAKGITNEDTAIEMVESVLGCFSLTKNETLFENDWICGTPDVVTEDEIIDIKCPFSSVTFLDAVNNGASDLYKAQLLAYMWLTGKRKSRLAFCLTNTPAYLTSNKEEVSYDHVPIEYKVHFKSVEWHESFPQYVSERVKMCRRWLQSYHTTQELLLGGNS